MTQKMLEMYVRNQILLDPTYMGEFLVVQGANIDTRPIAEKYQQGNKFKKQDGLLELYITAIRNNETLKMDVSNGKLTMSAFVETFKENLIEKAQLDPLVDKFMPFVLKAISSQCAYGTGYIVDDALMIPSFSEDMCNRALRHLFGCFPTRFIYNLANKGTNGNTLDLSEEIVSTFSGMKQEFFTYASIIRAFGYPYSDYRAFVNKGILVSIDLANRIYVVHDDYMYCISQNFFDGVLSDGAGALPDCRKVFNTRDMSFNTKAPIGGLR